MEITVTTAEALACLVTHRDTHIQEYKEQFRGWREQTQVYSDQLKEWAIGNSPEEDRPKELERPKNYLKQYEDLIFKVGKHVPDLITLSDGEFEKIFQDNFMWTSTFRSKTPVYCMGSPNPSAFSRGLRTDASELDYSGSLGSRSNGSDHIHIEVD